MRITHCRSCGYDDLRVVLDLGPQPIANTLLSEEGLSRPEPRFELALLRVVDLAQVQHVPLHHAPSGGPIVLDNAPVAMLLAILPANLAAQEHDGRRLSAHWRP
jgi:hypothetical protein